MFCMNSKLLTDDPTPHSIYQIQVKCGNNGENSDGLNPVIDNQFVKLTILADVKVLEFFFWLFYPIYNIELLYIKSLFL